jgi:hypothetical protein
MAPTATRLSYATPIVVDLSNNNTVNLVSVNTAGHRVSINVSSAAMNTAFKWSRAAGTTRPVGSYDASGLAALTSAITTGLNGSLTDADANLDLNFTSGLHVDARVNALTGTDRLVAPYILYKAYGRTDFNTTDVLLNPGDLSGMSSSKGVADQILENLADAANETAINKMFQDLVAADPGRFFDEAGIQKVGIFESYADTNGSSGSAGWSFTVGDKVELKLVFTFANAVSLLDGDGAGAPGVQGNTFIKANDVFYLRLQLTVI